MLFARDPEDLPISVVVTCSDPMTAHLLVADLRRQDKFWVIPCAADTNSISDCLADHTPNVLLMGTNSRDAACGRLSLLRRIRAEHPSTRTVLLLDGADRDLIAELFRAGIRGIFNRAEYDLERLCRCICCVSSGQVWANSEQLGFVLDVFAKTASLNVIDVSGEEMLTRREKDVVRLVAEGFSNREIAQQLGLSTHTVKNYLFKIFEKLGISSRAELVMYILSNSDNSPLRVKESDQLPVPKMPVRASRANCDMPAGHRILNGVACLVLLLLIPNPHYRFRTSFVSSCGKHSTVTRVPARGRENQPYSC